MPIFTSSHQGRGAIPLEPCLATKQQQQQQQQQQLWAYATGARERLGHKLREQYTHEQHVGEPQSLFVLHSPWYAEHAPLRRAGWPPTPSLHFDLQLSTATDHQTGQGFTKATNTYQECTRYICAMYALCMRYVCAMYALHMRCVRVKGGGEGRG